MADRPILFSAPMIRALLAGTKTQTRRALGLSGRNNIFEPGAWTDSYVMDPGNAEWRSRDTPYADGDRLWVRESYYQQGHWEPVPGARTKGNRQKWAFVPTGPISFDAPAEFRKGRHSADPATVAWHKRLGRFMPRAASRLTLTVTDVRVERLQDISEADAIAEGIFGKPGEGWQCYLSGKGYEDGWACPIESYRTLWDSINGANSWWANPWVVAVSFTVGRHNIDAGDQ